jgi:nucleotide-binding universal stress UspA family protein
LVAVDGSAHADRALQEAIDLARVSEAHITVMTSVPDLSALLWSGPGMGGFDVEPMMRENERQYESVLRRALDAVPEELDTDQVLTHGMPAQTIVEQVKRDDHDLVVMRSRGRGELKSLLLGSVSHAVLNTSPAAVLIVRASPDGN